MPADVEVPVENLSNAILYTPLYIICLVTRLIFILTIYYLCFKVEIAYNWPPLFLTMAFVYLLTTAIHHYRKYRNEKKKISKKSHIKYLSIMHGCTFFLLSVALFVALHKKVDPNVEIPNVELTLCWLGFITIGLYFIQIIFGFVNYLYPRVIKQYQGTTTSFHVSFGILSFTLAVTVAILGFSESFIAALDKEYEHFSSEGVFKYILGSLRVAYGVIISFMLTNSKFMDLFKSIPTPPSEP